MSSCRNTALAALLLAAGCAVAAPPASTVQPAPPVAAPARPAATPAQGIDKQDIRAQLAPRRFTSLAAEVGARINRISVREGDHFKAGQVLISLDCSTQAAQLHRARVALDGASKTHAANKRLAELNSIGKVELDASEAEVAKARADIGLISTTLSKCTISAPFAGRVAEQKGREQQYAQPGQPILDIIDDSVLELDFIVPSRWLAWLKNGHRFQVQIDETGATYPAKVTQLGARVDPVSQSIKVTATIDGRFGDLIAGMSGRVLLGSPPAAGQSSTK